jgi:SAM-dependent methyltransferase
LTFGDAYSRLYDSFYGEKDYSGEARFVLGRTEKALGTRRELDIIDLGCGTARHAIEFAAAGHRVHGVDLSLQMLDVARLRIAELGPDIAGRLSLSQGDIRDARVERTFDAAFCLFHVLSYLHEERDVLLAFGNARRHAKVGGVYLFDFWHGEAVLNDPPALRERTIVTEARRVHRVSSPEWDRKRSLVGVNYRFDIEELATGRRSTKYERHLLRYFFPSEIRGWLEASGFEVVEIAEWMTAHTPNKNSFSIYALARPD